LGDAALYGDLLMFPMFHHPNAHALTGPFPWAMALSGEFATETTKDTKKYGDKIPALSFSCASW